MTTKNQPAIRKHKSGSVWFDHPCHVCGKSAFFGDGVNLLLAHKLKDVKWSGVWTCGRNGCVSTKSVEMTDDLF